MNEKKVAAVAVAACLAASPARAVDAVAVETGHGSGTDMVRIALQWNWPRRWLEGAERHVGAYWDFALGHWRHAAAPDTNGELTEVAVTPVFRYQRNTLRGFYLEGGIGAHLLSGTSLGDKRFGSAFQFGDHIGMGYRFGRQGEFDVSCRFQHVSNGGLKQPNEGINFGQIRVQYHY